MFIARFWTKVDLVTMRVLIVDPSNYTPYYDYSLCKALRALQCQAELVTSPFFYEDQPTRNDVPTHYFFYRVFQPGLTYSTLLARLPRWARRALKVVEHPFDLRSLAQYVTAHRPALVHFQWSVLPWLDSFLFRHIKKLDIPIVFTVHEPWPYEGHVGYRRQQALLYPMIDQVIVPSEVGKVELCHTFSLDPARVHVIPIGNLDDWRRTLPQEDTKRILGIEPGQRVVLFFGVIKPHKGLGLLIEAFPRIKAEIPDARLLIVGHPVGDFSRYEGLIRRGGLQASTTVRLEYVRQEDLAVYLNAADVVVLPYLQAGHSAALVTAYTFGRPVVVTSVGGLAEAVEEGCSGHIVPPGDTRALAEAVCAILRDEDRAARMGRHARHLAETKYSWPRIARATLDVYERATGQAEGIQKSVVSSQPSAELLTADS